MTAPGRADRERTLGALDVAFAAALWGTAGTVQERYLPATSPLSVAGTRCLVAGLIVLGVLTARRRGRVALVAVLRSGGWPLVTATVAMAVFQGGYLVGIRTNGVALGTLVALGSAPAWSGFLALVAGRRPSRPWAVGTVLAVAGLAALVGTGGAGVAAAGLLASLAAGLAYAAYATSSARLGDVDRTAVVAVVFTVCGLVLLPAVLADPVPMTLDGLVGATWLVVATTVVAYLRFLRGLRHLDAPTATTLTLIEPVTATVLAVTVVGEPLGAVGALGIVALLVGVGVASRAERPTASEDVAPASYRRRT